MNQRVHKEALCKSDLIVDCVYEGGRSGNASDDPLHRLLPVSNQGGFRIVGTKTSPRLIVLVTGMDDPDWPDDIDRETGVFTYFGDNKKPGRSLHSTPRYGNELLRHIFDLAHAGRGARVRVPPVLVFAKTGEWRDVVFLGLAVPSTGALDSNEDLVAIWRSVKGERFQNYRAKFSILDAAIIDRGWIFSVAKGESNSDGAPLAWSSWVKTGKYCSLRAERALSYRSRLEQLPDNKLDVAIIERLQSHFSSNYHGFERCAVDIAQMMLPGIVGDVHITQRSRDGGRDAVGLYRIGGGESAITVEFALEAKCFSMRNAVGVSDVSRLISRLRNRQFGVLVTTSYLASQAYREIKDDGHPIVIIAAIDIVKLLRARGIGNVDALVEWLGTE